MSYDKVVDSTKLDGALSATADAIRTKSGKSGAVLWDMDEGFSEAFDAIKTFGTLDELLSDTATKIVSYCTKVATYKFYSCASLTHIDLPVATEIGTYAFGAMSATYNVLETLILRSPTLVNLANTNAFYTKTNVYIYVPSALIDTYKAATNWSTYAERFRAIEDYPDVTGG